jgi:hypothetical protein
MEEITNLFEWSRFINYYQLNCGSRQTREKWNRGTNVGRGKMRAEGVGQGLGGGI